MLPVSSLWGWLEGHIVFPFSWAPGPRESGVRYLWLKQPPHALMLSLRLKKVNYYSVCGCFACVHFCTSHACTLWRQKRVCMPCNSVTWMMNCHVCPGNRPGSPGWRVNALKCWAISPTSFDHWDLSSCAVVNKMLIRLISTPSAQAPHLSCPVASWRWYGKGVLGKENVSLLCSQLCIYQKTLQYSKRLCSIPNRPTLSWSFLHPPSPEPCPFP